MISAGLERFLIVMSENKSFELKEPVCVTFRVGRKWVTLYGKIEAINGERYRIRHNAIPELKKETSCGWYHASQIESEKEDG